MSNRAIIDAIRRMAGTYNNYPAKVALGTVTAVDINARTCTVDTIDTVSENEGVTVSLMAGGVNDGVLIVPTVNSTIAFVWTDITRPLAIQYSQVDEVRIISGNQTYDIKDSLQQFNDGSYGGLTKTQELKAQLDKTNEVVNIIVDSLSHWIVAANDGGKALQTYFTGKIPGKAVGDYSNIENTSITHGPNN